MQKVCGPNSPFPTAPLPLHPIPTCAPFPNLHTTSPCSCLPVPSAPSPALHSPLPHTKAPPPSPHWPWSIYLDLWGTRPSAPQAPTAEGGGRAGGVGVGRGRKGKAQTHQHFCSPIRNALIFVTAVRPIQLKIITSVFQVFILAKCADSQLHRTVLFVQRGLAPTAAAPPVLEGLKLW